MSDPNEIFLQPACCADREVGRLWCEDDSPEDCDAGNPWVRYVHVDKHAELKAENEALRGVLRLFTGAAYPVSTDIDPRGYRWSEAYLDAALAAAPPIPKGMQLVPVEPEEQDIQDALDAANLGRIWDDDTDANFPREFGMAFYRALLDAAKETT